MNRAVVLVDMDCFYVQVEQRVAPEFNGKPCAVAQYTQGGGLIAVNYEARAFGVKRGMRSKEAKNLCPDLHLFRVPEVRGKADLTKYRAAGSEVIKVLCQFSPCVERASIDEAYLDLTEVVRNLTVPVTIDMLPNTFVVEENGDNTEKAKERSESLSCWLKNIVCLNSSDGILAQAAKIVEEMRRSIFQQTGFRCSAGIAHNKVLAKLICGLHKPNKQTVLPQAAVPALFSTLSIHKMRNLGGKLGEEIKEKLHVETVGQLSQISKHQLMSSFGEKSGAWLYELARGIDHEPVVSRQLPKSIGCGKNFNGKQALKTKDQVHHWMLQLSEELSERLTRDKEENKRVAKLLTVTIRQANTFQMGTSRSCSLHSYDAEKIAHDAVAAIAKLNDAPYSTEAWIPPLNNITICATKFQDEVNSNGQDISKMFSNMNSSLAKPLTEPADTCNIPTTEPELFKNVSASKSKNISLALTAVNKTPSVLSLFKKQIGKSSRSETCKNKINECEKSKSNKLCRHFQESDLLNSPSKSLPSFADKLEALLNSSSDSEDDNTGEPPSEKVSIKEQSAGNSNGWTNTDQLDPVDESVLSHLPPDILEEIQVNYKIKPNPKGDKGLHKYFKTSPSKCDIAATKNLAKTSSEEHGFNKSAAGFKDGIENVCSGSVINRSKPDGEFSMNNPNKLVVSLDGFSGTKNNPPSVEDENGVGTENCVKGDAQESTSVTFSCGSFPDGNDSYLTKVHTSNCSSDSLSKENPLEAFDNDENLDAELVEMCSKCGRRIAVWKFQEHMDFHLAQELDIHDRSSYVKLPVSQKRKVPNQNKRKGEVNKKIKASNNKMLTDFFKKDTT